MPSSNKEAVRKIAYIGVFAALAVAVGWAERLVPMPVPGVRLGLGNGIILILLYRSSAKTAFGVMMIKITVTALLFGSLSSLMYSLAGGFVAFGLMAALMKTDIFGIVGVSAAAAVAHNAAQLALAAVILDSAVLIHYLPVLIISGTAAGVITGVTAALVMRRLYGL